MITIKTTAECLIKSASSEETQGLPDPGGIRRRAVKSVARCLDCNQAVLVTVDPGLGPEAWPPVSVFADRTVFLCRYSRFIPNWSESCACTVRLFAILSGSYFCFTSLSLEHPLIKLTFYHAFWHILLPRYIYLPSLNLILLSHLSHPSNLPSMGKHPLIKSALHTKLIESSSLTQSKHLLSASN